MWNIIFVWCEHYLKTTILQLIRYTRASSNYSDFLKRHIFIWETGYWTRAMKRFALFDLPSYNILYVLFNSREFHNMSNSIIRREIQNVKYYLCLMWTLPHFIVFGLTRLGLEPTICRIEGKHANPCGSCVQLYTCII
jgi:hypothetical protein